MEPMQPSIVADYERIAEEQMDDTCDKCEREIDCRLLEVVQERQGPLWLCPDCHETHVIDEENYWAEIGEDIRDNPEPR